MAALVLKLTDAGLAAVQAAAGSDPVVIAELGLTNTPFDYAPTLTGLPGEFKRISAVSGVAAAANIAHLTAYDTSSDVWTATGLGLFLDDGTLFAVHTSDQPVQSKASLAFALISIDIIFNADLAADIAFGNAIFTNPPATTDMRGLVELATLAEGQAALDQLRALTPAVAAVAVLSWLQDQNLQLGRVDVQTPDDGSTGGLRVHANADTGNAILQFVNDDGTGEFGHLVAQVGGALKWSGDTVWHAGNDGPGSGLNADLLDGKGWGDGQDVGFGVVTAQTPNVGSTGGIRLKRHAVSGIAYLQILDHEEAEKGFFSFHGNNIASWVGSELQVAGSKVWTAANDGDGSGLDADLLDGQHGSFYADIPARLGFTPMNAASYNDFLRAVAGSITENGYVRLSNGLMFCWGRFTANGNTSTAVTFPMAFPNGCFGVVASGTEDFSADAQDNWPTVRRSSITATGFSVFSADDANNGCTYFAWGG